MARRDEYVYEKRGNRIIIEIKIRIKISITVIETRFVQFMENTDDIIGIFQKATFIDIFIKLNVLEHIVTICLNLVNSVSIPTIYSL